MRRHLAGVMIAVEFRIANRDRDDFVILLARVDHGHKADGAGLDNGERDDGFLAEHQRVERIVVFGESLGDEP